MVAAWCSRCFHGRGSAAAMSAHRPALAAMKTSNACGDANVQDGTVAAQASATAGVWPSAMSQSAVQAGSIHGAPRVGHAQSTTRAACWVIYPSSRQQSERLRRCAGLVTLGLPRGDARATRRGTSRNARHPESQRSTTSPSRSPASREVVTSPPWRGATRARPELSRSARWSDPRRIRNGRRQRTDWDGKPVGHGRCALLPR